MGKKAVEEYTEDIQSFLKDPASRTADQTPSIKVLLARLLALQNKASLSLAEDETTKLIHFALEEEMRRMLKKDKEPFTRKQLLTILDTEWAKLVDTEVNKEFELMNSTGLSEEEKISKRMHLLVEGKQMEEEVKSAIQEKKPEESKSDTK